MDILSDIYTSIKEFIPFLAVLAVVILALWFSHWFLLDRKSKITSESKLIRQLLMFALTILGLLFVILAFPMSDEMRGSVLGLTGLVLTGIIALSSTSFVTNFMASLMLRLVKNFKVGDFVSVGEKFGRVTEIGLVHTEIQTEDRDLITFPNFYLVSNPVKVVRSSGTIISTILSLGYDLPRIKVEELLKKAATEAGLEESFVQVKELGDFSVSYRVAGFLSDVKFLLTVQSDLRKKVMDVLHNERIEIVSPSFMNQRVLKDGEVMIPKKEVTQKIARKINEEKPEEIIFDKADEAEEHSKKELDLSEMKDNLEELKKVKKETEKKDLPKIENKITQLEKQIELLKEEIASEEEKESD